MTERPLPPLIGLAHGSRDPRAAVMIGDLMRAAEHLGLQGGERRLPPDHLAPVCEVLAVAIEREEPVLIDGLRERYLEPWITAASGLLADNPAMLAMVRHFAADIAA